MNKLSALPRGQPEEGADAIDAGLSGPPERVLVVDDSAAQRRLFSSILRRAGYEVIACANGSEALSHIDDPALTLVICDWMMPGMDGIEFCRRARALEQEHYLYILILTSMSETTALARALDAGADDFLTKPVNPHELRARLRAGARVTAMQRELVEKNRLVSRTLEELSGLYEALDRDLAEARKLQESLLPASPVDYGPARAEFLLRPAGKVGGDLVGHFAAGDGAVGLYSIDVAGHGITSALITTRLAGMLSGPTPDRNAALTRDVDGRIRPRPPEEVAADLNRRMLEEMGTDLYFTLCLAILDLETGAVRMVQAGHPHPALLRKGMAPEFMGEGGLPVGLVPDAAYERIDLTFGPGDRLLMYSDGLTECPGRDGRQLEEAGLAAMLRAEAEVEAGGILEGILARLGHFSGASAFPDDLSAVLLEWTGEGPG